MGMEMDARIQQAEVVEYDAPYPFVRVFHDRWERGLPSSVDRVRIRRCRALRAMPMIELRARRRSSQCRIPSPVVVLHSTMRDGSGRDGRHEEAKIPAGECEERSWGSGARNVHVGCHEPPPRLHVS